MTPTQKYIEDQMKQCREAWFKDHVAVWIDKPAGVDTTTIAPRTAVILIIWQNPQSWNYGCRFIIHHRWLCVVGDIGEAVFEWGQDLTLDFLASCGFHYFMGKCQASPEGRKFESFDTDVAEQYRNARIAELKANVTDPESKGDAKELEVLTEISHCGKDEWCEAAREYYDATGDAEGASSISDMGVVPSVHAIGMFVGLQMAIAQLKALKTK